MMSHIDDPKDPFFMVDLNISLGFDFGLCSGF